MLENVGEPQVAKDSYLGVRRGGGGGGVFVEGLRREGLGACGFTVWGLRLFDMLEVLGFRV